MINIPLKCNLRDLRKRAGYTQAQVAQAIGISRRTYANAERGIRPANVKLIISVMTFLGVDFNEMFELEGSIVFKEVTPRKKHKRRGTSHE